MRRIGCLLVLAWAPGQEPAMRRALREVALAHSPRVEEGGPGLVYLDVSGLEALFGDERRLGERLRRAAAEAHPDARVGIAGSRIAALAAARRGGGLAVVGPGEDAAYLAPAPLSLLDLPDEMATRLGRWGIRTLGELAALPAAGLFERLGSEGLRLQRLARGEDPQPLRPWTPPPVFEESVERDQADQAMETLEPLLVSLADLLERICGRLVRRGLSADRLEWSCRLTDGRAHEGDISPAVPMNEPAALMPLLRASLEAWPPRGAVEALRLRVHPVRVPPGQGSLTDPPRPNPRLVAATLARLAALVGPERVGVPVLLDSHRPDAVTLAPGSADPPAPPQAHPASGGEERVRGPEARGLEARGLEAREAEARGPEGRGAALALRRLRPPRPASVTLTAGRPVHLRGEGLASRIVTGSGPWRASGEWWTEHPWIHDEWDVELGDGTVCRLAHDGSAWWLDGIYD